MEMNVLDQFPSIGVFLDQMGLEATLVQMPATAVAAKRNGCSKSSGANRPRRSDWRAVFGPAGESDSASGNTYGLRTRSAGRFLQASPETVPDRDHHDKLACVRCRVTLNVNGDADPKC